MKRYQPLAPGAWLRVGFACDPLSGPPLTITYEYGSGHGQNLGLLRLRREGGTLEALRIELPGPRGGRQPGVLVQRGSVPAAAFDAVLPAVRAFALAKLEERVPPGTMVTSAFFSTGNFHALVRLEDGGGQAIERAFTGYPSSEEQLRSPPLTEIQGLLHPLVTGIPWQAAPVDDDVRAFFVERYAAAGLVPPFRKTEWWVKERLVLLAAGAGTPALVPSLVELALTGGGKGASGERTREYAVDTLAALTGYDARVDGQGNPRALGEAVAEYVKACRR